MEAVASLVFLVLVFPIWIRVFNVLSSHHFHWFYNFSFVISMFGGEKDLHSPDATNLIKIALLAIAISEREEHEKFQSHNLHVMSGPQMSS